VGFRNNQHTACSSVCPARARDCRLGGQLTLRIPPSPSSIIDHAQRWPRGSILLALLC
jgi:hypothetical protein